MQVRIPRYIDELPQILWWEIDEVCLFTGLFGIGIIMGSTVIGLIAGVVSAYILQKLKSGRGGEYFMHWGYWNGFIPLKPGSHHEEFME